MLASDSMAGRPSSSIYEEKAAQYISRQFSLQSLKPKFQVFKYQPKDSVHCSKSKNVFCFINNRSDSTIIIGAHYDHLGLGGSLSMNMGKKGIHNGADDNASGIALLLGLVKTYPQWKNTNYNYVFVAYSAHEIGLFGSENFSKTAVKKYKKISLVINFDMVGRMNPELKWLKLYGTSTLKNKKSFFDIEKFGLHYRFENDIMLSQLDTKSFVEKQIPCLSISTGIHDDYHKMSDDEVKINYQGILLIQQLLEEFLKDY